MKKWYQSKTMWVNIIAAILGIIPIIDNELLTAIGVLDSTRYLAVVGVVTTILNVILRTITKTAITTKKVE
jgi:uncharacterized membrane protein